MYTYKCTEVNKSNGVLINMKKRIDIQTNEEKMQLHSGKQVERIDGLDLAMQIYPLLKDYFNGRFTKNTKGVLMRMTNGQVFQLTVTESALLSCDE